MSYCGVQYDGKKCECQLQVVPGITPATKQAANPVRICAYREFGVQVGCDDGCCPTDCSGTQNTSSEGDLSVFGSPIFIIILSVIFGLMLFAAIFYKKLVKNARFRIRGL